MEEKGKKIVVLNGSPKGENSVTLQHVNYIKKQFPQHDFQIIHISKRIKKIESDESLFREIIEAIRASDGVLWSFGLWILCVPAQYMRFIEMITELGVEDAFEGKYAAVMTTSIHYFDHTAHEYMRAVCEDLGMRFADAISLDMMDLEIPDQRQNMRIFAGNFFEAIERKTVTPRLFKPMTFSDFSYNPSPPVEKIDVRGKKVVVLTDEYDRGTNLGKMIDRFTQSFSDEIEVIDLNDVDMRNACMGCMRCGYDYLCVQKDGYAEFYNNRVRTADIIVFAGTVRGRYLSSTWKTFYDRAFFWNHTPSLVGKQLAYIISGPLSQNANLMQILEASVTARQDANLVDIITDEYGDSAEIDALLQDLAERMVDYSVKGYVKPQNFLAVGGHKIFRDDIWGRIRMIWQADHRYFRKHGKYDFPQKDYKMRFTNLIMMSLTKIPQFRERFYAEVVKHPKKQLEKIIEKSDD